MPGVSIELSLIGNSLSLLADSQTASAGLNIHILFLDDSEILYGLRGKKLEGNHFFHGGN